MRCLLFISFFLFTSYESGAQSLQSRLEKMMETYAGNNDFNGSVLIAKKGVVLLSKGYGYSDYETKSPNNENTIFQLGTLTELFTTQLVLSLDSKAAMGLEDKVDKYFPDFPNGNQITVKNLLTHSSGLYDYSIDTVLLRPKKNFKPARVAIMESVQNKPLCFYPGSKYGYCATDYYMAGLIIEKVGRWDYDDLLKERILKSCKMYRTGTDFPSLSDNNKATGYEHIFADTWQKAEIPDTGYSFTSYGLYSTTADMYKFYQSLSTHKLLPQDWQDLAYTPLKDQYAAGWKVERINGKQFLTHESNTPGFSGYVLWQKQDDLFIVFLQNNKTPRMPLPVIASGLIKCIYGTVESKKPVVQQIEKSKVEEPEPVSPFKKYLGKFQFTETFSLNFVLRGDELIGVSADLKEIRMIPEGPDTFRPDGIAAVLQFVKDNNGRVNKAILHQGGEDVPGKRVK